MQLKPSFGPLQSDLHVQGPPRDEIAELEARLAEEEENCGFMDCKFDYHSSLI